MTGISLLSLMSIDISNKMTEHHNCKFYVVLLVSGLNVSKRPTER